MMRIFIFTCCCLLFVSCHSATSSAKDCDNWLSVSIKKQASVLPDKRFGVSLEQVLQACEGAVPTSFKQSIQQGKGVDKGQQLALLQRSVKSYFPEACSETAPTATAKSLPHICLGNDFGNGPYSSILENVDAASYMFGKALEQELSKSIHNKGDVKRFMLNYFLGAAHEHEKHF